MGESNEVLETWEELVEDERTGERVDELFDVFDEESPEEVMKLELGETDASAEEEFERFYDAVRGV